MSTFYGILRLRNEYICMNIAILLLGWLIYSTSIAVNCYIKMINWSHIRNHIEIMVEVPQIMVTTL